jgi:hypothetical protein
VDAGHEGLKDGRGAVFQSVNCDDAAVDKDQDRWLAHLRQQQQRQQQQNSKGTRMKNKGTRNTSLSSTASDSHKNAP